MVAKNGIFLCANKEISDEFVPNAVLPGIVGLEVLEVHL